MDQSVSLLVHELHGSWDPDLDPPHAWQCADVYVMIHTHTTCRFGMAVDASEVHTYPSYLPQAVTAYRG